MLLQKALVNKADTETCKNLNLAPVEDCQPDITFVPFDL